MPTTANFAPERLELAAVVSAPVFSRAPRSAQLLQYLCHRYFDGEGDQIKEYSIAVEVLGRSAQFDQKKDSIVRVEMYHLRRRLREYYSGEGAAHRIRIEIPVGQYAPSFVVNTPSPEVLPETPELEAEAVPAALEVSPQSLPGIVSAPARSSRWRRPALWTLLLLLLAAGSGWWSTTHREPRAAAANVLPPVPVPTDEVRILGGVKEGSYVDGFGHVWQSDRYFQGGQSAKSGPGPIWGTHSPRLFQTRREGGCRYDIPLAPGTYELRLYFAETLYGENNIAGGGETSRLFHVRLNGQDLLKEFDVAADEGPSTADIRVFKNVSPAADGKVHLEFVPVRGAPFVNAIEITPGTPNVLRPLRMVASERSAKDKSGSNWLPDRYSRGGQLVARDGEVAGADSPDLFNGERYGNFSYEIPVAPGRYRVTLYFAERWFGDNKAGEGGRGSRVFDVLANGVMLLKKFDIYAEAGAADRAVIRTFRNQEPTAQGKLHLAFVPLHNYAAVNAVEVVDEADTETSPR